MLQGNIGEHEGTLKELDVKAIEDPNLVSSVEDRLSNLRDITAEPSKRSADDQEDPDDTTPVDKDDKQADDRDDSDKSTPDDKDGDKDVDKEEETLPSAYLRAAVHRGWKEKDAKELFENNPETALKVFQNCYMDVNNATREWALLGKAKMQKGTESDESSTQDDGIKLDGVDVDKLKKELDLDDNAIAIIRAQDEQLSKLVDVINARQVQPVKQEQQQAVNVNPDPNVELKLNNFFSSEVLKPYSDFYGELKLGQDWTDLGSGQASNRWRVIQEANYIIAGAESMGQLMDPLDALDRAHMLVTEPIREQVIRDQIRSTATKRKNSMTIKPSDGSRSQVKVAADAGGKTKPRTRKELTENVQEKLDAVFGSR